MVLALICSAVEYVADVIATPLLGTWKGHITITYIILRSLTGCGLEFTAKVAPSLWILSTYFYELGGFNRAIAIVQLFGKVNEGFPSLTFVDSTHILSGLALPWIVSLIRSNWGVVAGMSLVTLVILVAIYLSSQPETPETPEDSIAAVAVEDPFVHQPLALHESTRILVLLPETEELEPTDTNPADIRCKIEHISLDEQPEYDALSYCWGDSTKCRQIIIGGTPAAVTQSLYTALVRLRDKA